MRIAIPLTNGRLSFHIGFCECFALLDVDPGEQKILHREDVRATPPPPGLLPLWLAIYGVTVVLVGGMGERAQRLFTEQGIRVVVGATVETPERLVSDYLSGTLLAGENVYGYVFRDEPGEEYPHSAILDPVDREDVEEIEEEKKVA